VGWICFAVLVVTGTYNLGVRGVTLGSFGDAAWRSSSFGRSVLLKLALFTAVLVVSLVHDFFVGPRATAAILADPASPDALRLRKRASTLGRLNAVLALLLVAVAVTLVRGWPM
jgi:hypothetical protein